MRWFFLGSVWLVAVVMVRPAVGIEADNSDVRSCAACTSSQSSAPDEGGLRSSIRGPVYGTNPSPCCDKAWTGYCQEKAREQAFWSHIGSSSPLGCRIACRLEMLMAPWRWPAECPTGGSAAHWADKYQADPAPADGSAKPDVKPEAQPKTPDPPKAEKLSRWKQALSGLFR